MRIKKFSYYIYRQNCAILGNEAAKKMKKDENSLVKKLS